LEPGEASDRLGLRAAGLGAVGQSDKEVALTWQVSAGANLVIGAAYLAIAATIAFVLFRGGRLRTHRLGQAALLAFGTCGVQFCLIAALLLAPSLGIDSPEGEAMREAWPVALGVWALLGAAAALFLLSRRGSYGDVLLGPGLMEEVRTRERQALEINDNIVQGLSVAKYSLEQGKDDQSRKAIEDSLKKARGLITELLGEDGSEVELGPGDLRRERPAAVGTHADGG
jgi:hypothetical protein